MHYWQRIGHGAFLITSSGCEEERLVLVMMVTIIYIGVYSVEERE
jgi:hypothetical protein